MPQYNSFNPSYGKKTNRNLKKKQLVKFLLLIGCILAFVAGYLLLNTKGTQSGEVTIPVAKTIPSPAQKPIIQTKLLKPNPYSRPQTPLTKINGVVIHYVGNPGTTAESNRNYFNSLSKTKTTYASSHFIIDLTGTIIQCIPLNEISYASNERNEDTISIEVCHPDKTGKFTNESYKSLVSLTKWLCSTYNLNINDVIRHYDVTGKQCPLYFVTHEDAWLSFKNEVFT